MFISLFLCEFSHLLMFCFSFGSNECTFSTQTLSRSFFLTSAVTVNDQISSTISVRPQTYQTVIFCLEIRFVISVLNEY